MVGTRKMEMEMKVITILFSFERRKEVYKFVKGWNFGASILSFHFFGLSLKWEKKPGERMLLLMDFVYASNEHKTFKWWIRLNFFFLEVFLLVFIF